MSDQQIERAATNSPNEQIRDDLLEARKHINLGPNAKSWESGETHAEIYNDLIHRQELKIAANQQARDGAQNNVPQADSAPKYVPAAEELQHLVTSVKEVRDLAYAASVDRRNIIKQNGEADARDNLRDGYNALIQHMKDHPERAGGDVAVMRVFQSSANEMAAEKHWSEDQRDNALAVMLKAHTAGFSQDRIAGMVEAEPEHSR